MGGGDTRVIEELKSRYGTRIQHLPSLPREKALQLLSSCYYAYTPVRKGGWGFTGDCWATSTPLVMTHNDRYCATDDVDAIITTPDDIANAVNKLYRDHSFRRSLQDNGYKHYLKEHSAASVGQKIMKVITYVHDKKT